MTTAPKFLPLYPAKSPNLPIAPVEYDQHYLDKFANALRLYFNQLDNFTYSLGSNAGGGYVSFPFISAYYYPEQYVTGNNTPTVVKWSNSAGLSGFTLNANNTATAQVSGTYKITYSLQFANTNNTDIDVIVWLRVNGVDVTQSSTIFTVPARKSAGDFGYICGYSEVVFPLTGGDQVALWWGTTTGATAGGALGVYMYSRAAQTSPMPYPETPSAIGSITFVSAPA